MAYQSDWNKPSLSHSCHIWVVLSSHFVPQWSEPITDPPISPKIMRRKLVLAPCPGQPKTNFTLDYCRPIVCHFQLSSFFSSQKLANWDISDGSFWSWPRSDSHVFIHRGSWQQRVRPARAPPPRRDDWNHISHFSYTSARADCMFSF